MGFFNDSKPKKTDKEKMDEYLNNVIDYDGKTIMIISGLNLKWKYIEKLIEQGYEIQGFGRDSWNTHELILKKPTKKWRR